MTYGTHVHVHELGFTECAKSYVFQVRRRRPPLMGLHRRRRSRSAWTTGARTIFL